jgi:hypothetical protein
MALLLFLLLTALLAGPGFAQTGTCMRIGTFTSCSDSTGRQATILDLGGGFQSYSDNRGNTGSIVDIGPNLKHFSITPGVPPAGAPPIYAPPTPFPPAPAMPGFPARPGMLPDPLTPLSPPMADPFGLR